ncbi:Hydroxyisourate hydrolase [Fistulina hepatica ATCC 64428]|uniref:5-hydroxyisourate hydrolase n=1 Tax=Fistulina hepatica ATCC 64428 TaxID=1128425 RepID=A0A0D7ALX3_9AGAR|nr:Hydroxyisourate hydrolase [Fistulina hepatica ATCC 64428]
MTSPITCHVLDSSTGRPAEGVEIELQSFSSAHSIESPAGFCLLARGSTNADGRANLLQNVAFPAGIHKMIFKTKEYFERTQRKSFYPWVEIVFTIEDPVAEHYHIPLLISPYSYTTYRGS